MTEPIFRFRQIEIRPRERRLIVGGHEVNVGARAFDLLLVLVECRERLVTKQELLERVWPDVVVEEANLSVHVAALRKAIGARAIATIPGRGYRFAMDDSEASTELPLPSPEPPPSPSEGVLQVSAAPVSSVAQLPAADADPLIGREEDVYDIVAILHEQHMVTIVGEGGVGKTRLAGAVLQRLREDFVDGVWWVDLAAATQDRDVTRALARTLGAPVADGDADVLAQALAARSRMLVVLDNCEQVADVVARLANRLLDALPMLRMLATSRVPLHVTTEQVWRIETLSVPTPGATQDEARRCAAFELLERRARAADQRFVIDAATLPLAIEVCRRLEGHPLAIEMAAARMPQIGLAALCERLDHRLKLLRTSDRSRPDRQANLRSMLDWSVSLLEPVQRSVLNRLAVFAGSFGLAAAQTVAADDECDAWDVLDALAALVDHSLVRVSSATADGGNPDAKGLRYRMSATTRLYALDRLEDAGEQAGTRQRHRQAMVVVAEHIDALRWTQGDEDALATLQTEQEDLQSAFDDACGAGDATAGAHIGVALLALDRQSGLPGPRSRRAAAARSLLEQAPSALAAARLWDLIAADTLDTRAAEAAARRVQAWRATDRRRDQLEAVLYQARRQAMLGDPVNAQATMAQAERLLEPNDPANWQIEAAIVGAEIAGYLEGGDGRVARRLEQALTQCAQRIDAMRRGRAMLCLAELLLAETPDASTVALDWADRAIETLAVRAGAPALGRAWRARCSALLIAGDLDRARSAAAESLPLLRARLRAATLFDAIALLATSQGENETAAQLIGHADHWFHEHRSRHQVEQRLRDLALKAISAMPKKVRDKQKEAAPATTPAGHLDLMAQGAAADALRAETWARELVGLSEFD